MFRLTTYTILGIVLLVSNFSYIHSEQCIHDHIMESIATNVPHEHRQLSTTANQAYNFTVNEHGRALQSTFSPIRIKLDVSRLFDGADGSFSCNTVGAQYIPTLATRSTDRATCTTNDVITEEKRKYLIDVVFPAAVAFYTKALSVRPVSGNLKLPNPMPDYSCFNDGSYYYNLVCCDRNFPSALRTTGVADADYYLIVTARPTAGSVLAWATECQSDQYSRPLCGHANISPARMSMLAKDLPNQISVVVHELGHALGFSSSKYGSFRKPGTLNRVGSLTDVLSTTSDPTLGKIVKKIVTPSVVDFVKNHYNCPNWPNAGAEIEDYGGSGTAGSHWEKRLVMNEIMNPVSEPFMYKSGLFLSYFADSGWYSVDYSVAEKLPWGFNQGCDFVQKKCVDGWSNFYFCRTPNENGCTADMRYQAQCNLDDNPYVTYPAHYQYFPGSPGKGGKQPHTDYCPFYQLFSSRDCSDPGTIAYFFYGEKPGSGSRCLMGTYQLKTVSAEPAMHGGCLQTTCNSLTNLIEITLTGNPPLVVQCPKDGGNLDLSTITGSAYTGYIMCPPSKQLCTGDPCDVQDCNGRGKCNAADGTCTCDVGYSGPNAYSCSWKTCPSDSNTTICSGHGSCNKLTGVCEDGNGNAGCYAGWSGNDCSRQGCPKFNDIECAGNGNCVSGKCVCNAGFIGNDCSLTDCPGTPRCTDPGDNTVGKCDTSLGICSCADGLDSNVNPLYYYGVDCSMNNSGTRPFIPLNFVGEFDPSTNGTYAPVTGRLYPKEYAYFSFEVPTTQYPITLTFTALTAGTVSPAPMLTASYSTSGRPSALVHDFPTTTTADGGRKATIQFVSSSAGTSTFSKTGTILVSVVIAGSTGLSYVDYSMELKRDGCATLQCAFGYCSNSRCVCDRLPEASSGYVTYGWSGTLCDEPDCPGTPDCGGKRGTCVVPSSAYMTNGSAIRNNYPSCSCSGVFSGQDCSSYSSQADRVTGTQTTYILDGTWSTRVYTDSLTSEYWVKNDGSGATTLNGTYTGTLAIGDSTNKLLIDPDTLALVGWGLNGSLGLYLSFDFSSTPSADGMLMTQVMVPPTLTDYRDFDIRSWRATEKTQEISTVLSSLTFVNIFNGYYGKEILSYTLRMELSSGCPPSLRGCSGHGTCGLVCECEVGWEGIRCDIPVPQIETGNVYETNELTPGDWQYFVFRPSDAPSSQEVTLSLTRTSVSTASWPLLVAAWDSGRYGTSIGKVTAETIFMDYDALIARNGTQEVTIRRANTLSQKWLYIGIRNLPTARTSYIGTIGISESSSITMTLCSSTDAEVCRTEKCFGRGTYTVVRDVPSCECDYGWNKDTACASPVFASFSNLLTAAQNVGFLCSVCTDTAAFNRDQMSFFKIPQPLQKGTGLSLDVRPVEGTIVTPGRRLQSSTNTTGVTGHPSLLVSASLPRSILDFVYIESGQNANQTITITEASATGSYWAAVYANTPGTFLLSAQRAKIPIPPVETVDNVAALLKWLQNSTAGYVVLGVGGFLMAIVVLSCLCQCCCGRTAQLSKIRERFNQLEDEHIKEAEQLERSMIRVASLDPDKLAQTPALAKALERKKSTRVVLENARNSKALLDGPKSNFSAVPTTGSKPVFTVAPPVILGAPIPSNPRVQVGQGPSVAKTSILMQAMNQQQQPKNPLSSANPNEVHNVQQLRAALSAAAHGGGGGNPGAFQGSNPNYHH